MYTKKDVFICSLSVAFGLALRIIYQHDPSMFVFIFSAVFFLYFFHTSPVAVMGSIVRPKKDDQKNIPLKVVKFPPFKK
jgi:hypothetical protein